MFLVGQAVKATASNMDVPEGTLGIILEVTESQVIPYYVRFESDYDGEPVEVWVYPDEIESVEEAEE